MSKVRIGILWSSIEKFSVQGIQLVISIILSRILFPSDYGLVAILMVFFSISQCLVDGGFTKALIQKQNRTIEDSSTVFYFNILTGFLIYIILFLSAETIADFFQLPQLNTIIKIGSLNIIITSLSTVQMANLTIDLNFKTLAKISLFSVVLSGAIAIYLAFNNYGVWSIIIQLLLGNLITTSLLWKKSTWRPQMSFSTSSFKSLFHFGSKLMISSLITSIYGNLYNLTIGKFINPSSLGLFNRATSLTQFPSANISSIVSRVTFPILCGIQDDNKLLLKKFNEYVSNVTYIVFPLMVGLLVLAKPLVIIILTAKWIDAVVIIQILCVGFMLQPIQQMNWELLSVKHKSNYALNSEVIKKLVAIIMLIITIPFGLIPMCIGLSAYSFIDVVIITFYTKKVLPEVNFVNQTKNLLPNFLLSITMGAFIFIAIYFIDNNGIKLIFGVLVGVLYYFAASYLFKNKSFLFLYKNLKTQI